MTDLFSLGPILTMKFGPRGHILFARFGPMLQNVVLPSLIDNHPLYLEDLIFPYIVKIMIPLFYKLLYHKY